MAIQQDVENHVVSHGVASRLGDSKRPVFGLDQRFASLRLFPSLRWNGIVSTWAANASRVARIRQPIAQRNIEQALGRNVFELRDQPQEVGRRRADNMIRQRGACLFVER
ncbi:hypothetical protein [Erythrobacter sp. SD-21]|uniref:hypothetical protein n=1 Tax=Erythrobacter sp. SD-21 TaxID=161528 RepID=UPI000154076E|nr:hypothetical protein [Erythrobacter sp. SD-21]EDL47777.1 hypothetical protein ED21_31324 [Erythrobacter sp. SD-21]